MPINMGKTDKSGVVVDNPDMNELSKQETPPKIPPRMKKNGPALPEKPAHMRANSKTTLSSSHPIREPLRPRILNMDKDLCSQREVLVAASKASREKPVDKRQREPPKLLMPTSGVSKKLLTIPPGHVNDYIYKKELSILPSKGPIRLEDCIPPKKDISILPSPKNPLWSHEGKRIDHNKMTISKKSSNRPMQPVLLIPRSLLTWGSTPVSYALWTQRDVGKGGGIRPVSQSPIRLSKAGPSDTSAVRVRSSSVTRSGSLTSQGSSSSDSGGETFPKSVLKKQKRSSASTSTATSSSKASSSNHKVDTKKNVTFNAYATVQLMEE